MINSYKKPKLIFIIALAILQGAVTLNAHGDSLGLRGALKAKLKKTVKGALSKGASAVIQACSDGLTGSEPESIFRDGGFAFEVIRGGRFLEIHASYLDTVSLQKKKNNIQLPGNDLLPNYERFLELNSLLGGRFIIPTVDRDNKGEISQVYLSIVDRKLQKVSIITPDSGSDVQLIENPGGRDHLLIQVGDTHLVDFIHYDRLPRTLAHLSDDWSKYSKRVVAITRIQALIGGPARDDHELAFSKFDFSQWSELGHPIIRATLIPKGEVDSPYRREVLFFAAHIRGAQSSSSTTAAGIRSVEGTSTHLYFPMEIDDTLEIEKNERDLSQEVGLDPLRFVSLGEHSVDPTVGDTIIAVKADFRTGVHDSKIKFDVYFITPGAPVQTFVMTHNGFISSFTPDMNNLRSESISASVRVVHIPMLDRTTGEVQYTRSILFKVAPHRPTGESSNDSTYAVLKGINKNDAPVSANASTRDFETVGRSPVPSRRWGPITTTYRFRTSKKYWGTIQDEDEIDRDRGIDESLEEHYLFLSHVAYHQEKAEATSYSLGSEEYFITSLLANPEIRSVRVLHQAPSGIFAPADPIILELDLGPKGKWYATETGQGPDSFFLIPADQKSFELDFNDGDVQPHQDRTVEEFDQIAFNRDSRGQLCLYRDPQDANRIGWTIGYIGGRGLRYHTLDGLKPTEESVLKDFIQGDAYTDVIEGAYDPLLEGVDMDSMSFRGFGENSSFYWTAQQRRVARPPLRRILRTNSKSSLHRGLTTYDLYDVQIEPNVQSGFLVAGAADINLTEISGRSYQSGKRSGNRISKPIPRHEEYSPSKSKEASKVLIIPPNDANEKGIHEKPIIIDFNGQAESVEIAIDPDSRKPMVLIKGRLPSLGGTVPVVASYQISSSGVKKEYELVNLVEKPVCEDEERGIKFYKTEITPDRPPSLWMEEKGVFGYRQLKLNFQYADDDAKKFLELLKMIFGLNESLEELEAIWQSWGNENPLPIRQDGVKILDNDLVEIRTEPSRGIAERTYFYSLSQKKTLFFLPRYRARYVIDEFQFYVGKANQVMNIPAYVTVLDKDNKFVTHFDLGTLDLDFERAGAIEKADGRITFNLKNGERRVFDLEQNYFLGWVSPEVEKKLSELEAAGTVLNKKVVRYRGRKIIGRDKEIDHLESLLPFHAKEDKTADEQRNTALLIGPRRAGKFSAVREWMRRYVNGTWKEEVIFKPVFFKLTPGTAIAGTEYRGALGRKYQDVISAANAMAQNGHRLVLVLEDADVFLRRHRERSRGEGSQESEFSGLLLLLAAQNIDVVATATEEGWSYIRRHSPEMAEVFNDASIVPFKAMSKESTVEALLEYYKGDPHLDELLTPEMTGRIVSQIQGIRRDSASPGTEFALFDALSSRLALAHKQGVPDDGEIDSVIQALSNISSYPTEVVRGRIDAEYIESFVTACGKQIRERVLGQEHVVEEVMKLIRRVLIGSGQPGRPHGLYLFAGPTGVGKTEVVRQFAQCLGVDTLSEKFLFINGSDYVDPGTGSALHLRKLLSENLQKNPFLIIVFDEFEKIHPEYQKIILPLGNGKVTAADGRSVSAEHAVVFLTSNIGSREASQRTIGLGNSQLKIGDPGVYIDSINRQLPQEQIGRLDIVVFNALSEEQAFRIARNMMDYSPQHPTSLGSRYANLTHGRLQMTFSDAVIREIAQNALKDIRFGARSIEKTLRLSIENEINKVYSEIIKLLSSTSPGDDHDGEALKVVFDREAPDQELHYRVHSLQE